MGRTQDRTSRFRQAVSFDVDDRWLTIEVTAYVSGSPIEIEASIAKAEGPEIGGVGIFLGTVRASPAVEGHAQDDVQELEYEAHETLASERLRAICLEAGELWDVRRAVAIHRTGRCALGEVTVVIACGAPHRKDALEACRWIIDKVKSTVPIFKREIYANGAAWVVAEGREGSREPSEGA